MIERLITIKMPYIYLVQPVILQNTNRYKIGVSSLSNLSRLKAYGNGTRYLTILECENPFKIEKELIKKFNLLFKKIGGNEYFQVDIHENDLIKLFIDFVLNFNTIKDEEIISSNNIIDEWKNKYTYTK